MGGASKAGLPLQLVDARGVVKNRMDGKCYLLVLRQDLFDPNSDETMLDENQIECYGVKVFFFPGVFVGKQLAEARDQVGNSVKIGISWYNTLDTSMSSPPY